MAGSRSQRRLSSRQVPIISATVLLVGTTTLFFVFVCPYLTKKYTVAIPIYEGCVAFFVFANFINATFKDPGTFPRAFKTAEDEDDIKYPLFKNVDIKGITVRMKWCETCSFYRPPRCSHCSICNNCIENFDHHCPWVDNCIGKRNYRFFFKFVFSLSIHIISVFTFTILHVLDNKDRIEEVAISICILIICGITAVPVLGLTGFHIGLVSMGRTTNEQVTGKFRSGHNPFDEGCFTNIQSVLCQPQFPSYLGYHDRLKKLQNKKKPEDDSVRITIETSRQSTQLSTADVNVELQQSTDERYKAPANNDFRSPRKGGQPQRPDSFVSAVSKEPFTVQSRVAMPSHSKDKNLEIQV